MSDTTLILPEDEYHKRADGTIHDPLEKLENQVLTLRLGELGTCSKQANTKQTNLAFFTFERLSTIVRSGPSRFDWDASTNGWIYRRTGANLVQLLVKEIGELCGTPVELS
uniref:Uncharacterized protein n=1 Tax=Oryza punctata TaxID=4537 RepID=A0A0E0JIT4_ORYPU